MSVLVDAGRVVLSAQDWVRGGTAVIAAGRTLSIRKGQPTHGCPTSTVYNQQLCCLRVLDASDCLVSPLRNKPAAERVPLGTAVLSALLQSVIHVV